MIYIPKRSAYLNHDTEDFWLHLFYDSERNVFTDEYGKIIFIYDYITYDDLYLFHKDPGYCVFQHCKYPEIAVEIVEPFNEHFDEEVNFYEKRHNSNYRGCSGGNCSFSSDVESDRREICSACGCGN